MGISVWKPWEGADWSDKKNFGSFFVQCFSLPHNGTPNVGYYIREKKSSQKILYLTDFEYCQFSFKALEINHVLVECNYQKEITSRDLPQYVHKIRGHCSLETCKNFILANQTNALRSVILCHMGADTAIPEECVAEVQKAVGNGVCVDYARSGLEVELIK